MDVMMAKNKLYRIYVIIILTQIFLLPALFMMMMLLFLLSDLEDHTAFGFLGTTAHLFRVNDQLLAWGTFCSINQTN